MRQVYNQANISLDFDGTAITDLSEGSAVVITTDGGEVQKTEGTDGPAVNIATDQGGTCKITLKETSSSHGFLQSVKLAQKNGSEGGQLTVRSGTDVLHLFGNTYVSQPGELSTGDKKMGSQQYTFVSTSLTPSNQ